MSNLALRARLRARQGGHLRSGSFDSLRNFAIDAALVRAYPFCL